MDRLKAREGTILDDLTKPVSLLVVNEQPDLYVIPLIDTSYYRPRTGELLSIVITGTFYIYKSFILMYQFSHLYYQIPVPRFHS